MAPIDPSVASARIHTAVRPVAWHVRPIDHAVLTAFVLPIGVVASALAWSPSLHDGVRFGGVAGRSLGRPYHPSGTQ